MMKRTILGSVILAAAYLVLMVWVTRAINRSVEGAWKIS